MYTNTYKFNSFSPPQVNVPPTLPHAAATVHPKDITYCIKLYFFKKTFSKKSKVFEKLTTTINIFTVTNKTKKTSPPQSGYIPKYH